MHPVLEHTAETIEATIGRATEAAMHRRASADEWSPAAILEHLALSYSVTTGSMHKALEKHRPIGHAPSLAQRLAQLIVIGAGYFPAVEAPPATRPTGIAPSAALTALRNNLVEMDAAITECEQTFGARARIADHQIFGGLTPAGWRRFHFQHARHHARQIRVRLARSGDLN